MKVNIYDTLRGLHFDALHCSTIGATAFKHHVIDCVCKVRRVKDSGICADERCSTCLTIKEDINGKGNRNVFMRFLQLFSK